MSSVTSSADLVAQVQAQLAEVERRIDNLVALRNDLKRVLMRLVVQTIEDTNKSNLYGARRSKIENKVLEALEAAQGQPVPTRVLFEKVRDARPELKYATFRSHLSRFKKRGLIVAAKSLHGCWQLRL